MVSNPVGIRKRSPFSGRSPKRNEAAQATQKSRVKPRPVIEKALMFDALPLILADHDALANVHKRNLARIVLGRPLKGHQRTFPMTRIARLDSLN